MSAGRSSNRKTGEGAPPPQPSKHRDGFELISRIPIEWTKYQSKESQSFVDITYDISIQDRCSRIAFNRPNVLHAFRPQTIREIQQALQLSIDNTDVSVIILTSNNIPKYTPAFCAGGDQTVRNNNGGYQDGTEVYPKLRVLELQVEMRRCPKPIMCVVDGYAIGGGHILHMMCDLTIASNRSIFGQTGPRMGSFDAGYGSTRMTRLIGQKRSRELWFLCRYMDSKEAYDTGLINASYPLPDLDGRTAQWVRRINMNSSTAITCVKMALNADEDGGGAFGIQQLGGQLTKMFYQTKESQEGRDAFLQKRPPNFILHSKL
ncbi:ClpP/crotonase [Fragilariopsis cylindrus CCMP1102]|uniref:ClpP/crotonase n=1 Tax=Fragilariopsis cylindrus CCMP1102 TaxID=635003 RepID=A0A1E7FPX7_9STRA|nr:ClpP/crotonase [Fragilariopsis cylindrus CCMP1102]|eukprot:OEU20211.1 ClpP/crotonase [Fragilariopsis cylindrus CCMP1102]